MPALHIRKVDDAVIAALKRRAEANERSRELREILRAAVFGESRGGPGHRRRLRLKTVSVDSDATFDRREIYGNPADFVRFGDLVDVETLGGTPSSVHSCVRGLRRY